MSTETDDAYKDDAEPAFTQSDNHALGELELQPFTPERFVAAQGMGMIWPGIVAQGPRNTILYKGQANDAVILLWLCHIPSRSSEKDEWTVKRASRLPDEAHEEAMRWAAERGITKPNSQEFWQAMNKFTDILLEINNSYTVPQTEGANQGPPRPN